MRVHLKLAFACLIGIAASGVMAGKATAGVVTAPFGGLDASAHVSSLLTSVDYQDRHDDRQRFCYAVHIQCELDAAGSGWRYERCMRLRRCYPRYDDDHGDIYEYRRQGRSCRYWYHRCRDNWYYPEDVRGCLRFYGCDRD